MLNNISWANLKNRKLHGQTIAKLKIVGMWNFPDTFERRKQSLISALSISTTVLLIDLVVAPATLLTKTYWSFNNFDMFIWWCLIYFQHQITNNYKFCFSIIWFFSRFFYVYFVTDITVAVNKRNLIIAFFNYFVTIFKWNCITLLLYLFL